MLGISCRAPQDLHDISLKNPLYYQPDFQGFAIAIGRSLALDFHA